MVAALLGVGTEGDETVGLRESCEMDGKLAEPLKDVLAT